MDISELTVGSFVVRKKKKKNSIVNPSCRLKLVPHKKATRGNMKNMKQNKYEKCKI